MKWYLQRLAGVILAVILTMIPMIHSGGASFIEALKVIMLGLILVVLFYAAGYFLSTEK